MKPTIANADVFELELEVLRRLATNEPRAIADHAKAHPDQWDATVRSLLAVEPAVLQAMTLWHLASERVAHAMLILNAENPNGRRPS